MPSGKYVYRSGHGCLVLISAAHPDIDQMSELRLRIVGNHRGGGHFIPDVSTETSTPVRNVGKVFRGLVIKPNINVTEGWQNTRATVALAFCQEPLESAKSGIWYHPWSA